MAQLDMDQMHILALSSFFFFLVVNLGMLKYMHEFHQRRDKEESLGRVG